MGDNNPTESPAAFLLTGDSAGQAAALFVEICDLSTRDYKRYKAAYDVLDDVLFSNSFSYFRGSAKTFGSVWMDANKAFASGEIRPTYDPDGLVLWTTQLRSVALTLCLSLCYHQEQTLQEVSEKHGSQSDAFSAARAIFSTLHDTYPGYRYMYALRNVMIHDAMDAIALEAEAMLDSERQPVAVWDLQLDRKILSRSKKLNSAKKAEFAQLTENPSLPELFSEIAKPMMEANSKLLSIIHPDLSDVCETAVEFDKLFNCRVGTRVLSRVRSPHMRPGMQIGFLSWPDEMITFAKNYSPGQQIRRQP